jgi:hypothetical protein
LTNETNAFVDDFRELLTTFADEGVDFVLIGGWALGLHGHGRGTDDLDDVDWLEKHPEEE